MNFTRRPAGAPPPPRLVQSHLALAGGRVVVGLVGGPAVAGAGAAASAAPAGAAGNLKRTRSPRIEPPQPEHLDYGPHAVNALASRAAWEAFLASTRAAAGASVGLLLREREGLYCVSTLAPGLSPQQQKHVVAARRVRRKAEAGAGGRPGERVDPDEEEEAEGASGPDDGEKLVGIGVLLLGGRDAGGPSAPASCTPTRTDAGGPGRPRGAVPSSSHHCLHFLPLDGAAQLPAPVLRFVAQLFTQASSPVLAFDAQGILRRLFARGLALHPGAICALDPAVMAWLEAPDAGSYTLADCCADRKAAIGSLDPTQISIAAEQGRSGGGPLAAGEGLPGPLARLGTDLLLAARLADGVFPALARLGLLPALRAEMRVAFLLASMETRGLGFDPAAIAGVAERVRGRLEQLRAAAQACVGRPDFNPASNSQVAQVLYGDLGLVPPNKAPTMQRARATAAALATGRALPREPLHPSTNEEALIALQELHPLPGLLLEFRGLAKMAGTWLEPLPAMAVGEAMEGPAAAAAEAAAPVTSWRIHCQWNHLRTETGRLSCSGPNLQAVPRFPLRQGPPLGGLTALEAHVPPQAAPATARAGRSNTCTADASGAADTADGNDGGWTWPWDSARELECADEDSSLLDALGGGSCGRDTYDHDDDVAFGFGTALPRRAGTARAPGPASRGCSAAILAAPPGPGPPAAASTGNVNPDAGPGSSKPGSQDDVLINLRDAFVARPGYLLVSADYGQVELRVLAHLASDPALCAVLQRAGPTGDVFRQLAGQLWNVLPEEVTIEARERAKRAVYGIIYGQGPPALGRVLGISPAEATTLMSSIHAAFPNLRVYENRVKAEARRMGHVRMISGRRRPIAGLHAADFQTRGRGERQAVNTVVQGSAADIMKIALIKYLMGRLWPLAPIVACVHDELLLEVPEALVPSAAAELRHVMSNAQRLSVPLTVSVKAGRTWGDLQPLAEGPAPVLALARSAAPGP